MHPGSNHRHFAPSVYRVVVFLLLTAMMLPAGSRETASAAASTAASAASAAAPAFEPNAGQSDPAVRFLARSRQATLFFTDSGVVLALREAGPRAGGASAQAPEAGEAVVRMGFVAAKAQPEAVGLDKLPGVVNYLRGNEPAHWQTGLPTYARIQYRELYPGIALEYRGGAGSLKGTYIVAAGADPARIRWRYDGASEVRIDERSGSLEIGVAGRAGLVEQAPVAWQTIGVQRVPVAAAYTLAADGTVALALGPYDHGRALAIDPQLMYSTYLGGNAIDEGQAVAIDGEGNMYVAGFTASTNFPTANPLQPGAGGLNDAFVVKLNPSGSAFVYATYLGGSKNDEVEGIAVDRSGNAVVAGFTQSPDWPVVGARQGTLLNINGEGFVAKLAPTGSGLIFSTYLGGYGGAAARGVAVDFDGNVYVTGSAEVGFPLLAPYQNAAGGGDAFVTKFNPAGTRFLYSTYFGGSGIDMGYGIAVDWAGNAYITGSTTSDNLPVKNAFQPQCRPLAGYTNCSLDAFVSELSADGSTLVYSTYLGSSATDRGYAIAVDEQGNIAVTGVTMGSDFPTVNAAQGTYGGAQSDAFVAKLVATGGQPVFSTYLGGSGVEYATRFGIAVEPEGKITVGGSTNSTNFPVMDPLQVSLTAGGVSGFVTQYGPGGQPAFSSYWGANSGSTGVGGVAADAAGNVFLTGVTRAHDLWTMAPLQGTFGGGVSDAYLTKIRAGYPVRLQFSQPYLAFDQYRAGETSAAQTVVVHNASTIAGTINSVTVAVANPLDFAIAGDSCTGAYLSGETNCEISVTFSPRASGLRTARVEISGLNFPGTRSIPLRGKGAPTAELAPGPLEFPIARKNTAGIELEEKLTNVGLEPLTINSVTITGTDATDFVIAANGCTYSSIPPLGNCSVTVRFMPHADGFRNALLTFGSSVFDAPVRAGLSGIGGELPSITVDGAEWGMCAGQTVTVHGLNFPLPGSGNQGQYEVYFDGVARAGGTTDANGRFEASFLMPPLVGTSHVISATDTQLTWAKASTTLRTPELDLPVILIPGVSASYLDTYGAWVYWSPPDPDLMWPTNDAGYLIPFPQVGWAGEHIWLDWVGVGAAMAGNHRFFDILGLRPDGVSPQPDWRGEVTDLQLGSILWDLNFMGKYSDFFKGLSDSLKGTGRFTDTPGDGRNLYYFPYDWRKDIRLTGPLLNDMVNQALATSHKDKVVILAHSMGGLVARNYLLQYGTAKVDQFISMATPFLGSPLVGKVLEAGDPWGIQLKLFGVPIAGMHPFEMRRLAQNFTSSYELLMSRQYFQADPTNPNFDPRYMVVTTQLDNKLTQRPLDYTETMALMNDRHNKALNQSAERFRDSGIGDLGVLAGQLFHERIVGAAVPTIGKVILAPREVCTTYPLIGVVCSAIPQLAIPLTNLSGDDTVSLQSGRGANAPADGRVYELPGISHTLVPSRDCTFQLVNNMLLGRRCNSTNPPLLDSEKCILPPPDSVAGGPAAAVQANAAESVTGVEVMAAGNAALTATDSQGRKVGAVEGMLFGRIDEVPGATYEQSAGGEFIALTAAGTYTLTLRGITPTGAASVRISTLQDGAITGARLFETIPVTGTTVATVTLTLPGPVVSQVLQYKLDAQTPLQEAPQLPPLEGAAALDFTPPLTHISIGPDRMITLTATDTGGSGVKEIMYSTEGVPVHYQAYSGPFPWHGPVTAIATDWAGNTEYATAKLPALYLPLLRR